MSNIFSKIEFYLKRIINIPYATYMCIRFPFLYPRNRFTDKHYNNWKLLDLIKRLSINNKIFINVVCTKDNNIPFFLKKSENDCIFSFKEIHCHNYDLKIDYHKDGGIINIIVNNVLIKTIPISQIVKSGDVDDVIFFAKTVNNNIQYYILLIGQNIIEYNFNEVKNYFNIKNFNIEISKFTSFKIKLLKFIHDYFLQWIFCLTSYTELDAMPKGWKKSFGIQMCKELKKELTKSNFLYDFRIMQLKEKWGGMELYCNYYSSEISDIIKKYNHISYYTCCICGEPAHYLSKGWICPYCRIHAPEGSFERDEFYGWKKLK